MIINHDPPALLLLDVTPPSMHRPPTTGARRLRLGPAVAVLAAHPGVEGVLYDGWELQALAVDGGPAREDLARLVLPYDGRGGRARADQTRDGARVIVEADVAGLDGVALAAAVDAVVGLGICHRLRVGEGVLAVEVTRSPGVEELVLAAVEGAATAPNGAALYHEAQPAA